MTARDAMSRGAKFCAAALVTSVFFINFINFCNWIYRCGCRSLWAGADTHCNVHRAGVRGCPFCAHGTSGYAFVLALILIPQFIVSWWPRQMGWLARLILTLLVFPAMGLIAAVVLGWADAYWV
jgi:hypothetical protein